MLIGIAIDPGETWSYYTAGVVALGGVIHEATCMLADEFAESNLFGPLGISSYNWEYTTSGQVDTGGHIHMRPRDMAKIGELMLHRGQWGAQQLLSDTWVDLSTTPRRCLPSRSRSWSSTSSPHCNRGLGGQV
jgi:CubicO group peptidase (beta-lactamase class C family)